MWLSDTIHFWFFSCLSSTSWLFLLVAPPLLLTCQCGRPQSSGFGLFNRHSFFYGLLVSFLEIPFKFWQLTIGISSPYPSAKLNSYIHLPLNICCFLASSGSQSAHPAVLSTSVSDHSTISAVQGQKTWKIVLTLYLLYLLPSKYIHDPAVCSSSSPVSSPGHQMDIAVVS